jgi:glycosyltransferase involved in cell wall biosynthesis
VVFSPSIPREKVPDHLAAADAIVVLLKKGPLYEESLPTKLLEGLAAGRPVVVSADGYAARVVRDHSAGRTAPAEDPSRLADAIRSAIAPDASSMGARARHLAESEFSRARSVQILHDLLSDLSRIKS